MSSSRNAEPQLGNHLAVAALIIPITLIGYVISIPAIALGCLVDLYLEGREAARNRSEIGVGSPAVQVQDLRSSSR